MKNTIEDFKIHVENVTDESEIDNICFSWLKMLCMEYGKDGERASILLDLVKDILDL